MSNLIYLCNQSAIFHCANFPTPLSSRARVQTNQLKIHAKTQMQISRWIIDKYAAAALWHEKFSIFQYHSPPKEFWTISTPPQNRKLNKGIDSTMSVCGIINQNNIICIFFACSHQRESRIDPLRMCRDRENERRKKKHFPIYNNNTISWCSEQFFILFLYSNFPLLLSAAVVEMEIAFTHAVFFLALLE